MRRLTRFDCIPAVYVSLGAVSLFASRAVVVLLVLACFGVPRLSTAVRNVLGYLSTPAGMGLAGLMAWSLVSSIWAPVGVVALSGAFRVVLLGLAGLVFVAAVAGLAGQQREVAQKALCYGALVAVIILVIEYPSDGVIAQFLLDSTPDLQYTNRASAIFSVLVWPVAIVLGRRSGRDGVVVLCVVGALFVIWLLPMRASPVALVCGAIAAGATYAFRNSAIRLIAVVLVASMFALPWIFTYPPAQQAIAERRAELLPSRQERLVVWEFVSTKALEAPFIGHGFRASRRISREAGSKIIVEPSEVGKISVVSKLPLHPHNWVLQIWLELGLIGVGLAAVLLSGLIGIIGKHRGDPLFMAAAMGSLVTYFCIASLSFGFWQKWWLATGWLALGTLALVAPRSDEVD